MRSPFICTARSKPPVCGTGLGARVLQWAETGIHFPEKTRIRLDCVADSDALHSFIGVWDMNSWVLMRPDIICLRKRLRQNKRPLQGAFCLF